MNAFDNYRKQSFLDTRIKASIESKEDDLVSRSKFNFSYMDFSQPAGQKFSDWSQEELYKLLGKLKDFSRQSLYHWENEKMGGGKKGKLYTVLEIYGDIPKNTDFIHSPHVPHEALWGRFRLGNLARLIGFILPDNYHNKPSNISSKYKYNFDRNTFYVVFLDKDHLFCKTKKR